MSLESYVVENKKKKEKKKKIIMKKKKSIYNSQQNLKVYGGFIQQRHHLSEGKMKDASKSRIDDIHIKTHNKKETNITHSFSFIVFFFFF